ncbi:MAG TPA: helix-hairpin-helix domain-containing protein [Pyrinomonadaceae bacterium]|nr:helix-hairpin-helix domain-containing protein [Pyrinomonadaceae bacterium]
MLWKSLWKSAFLKLQVPDNFRLVALCTHRRQKLQGLCGQQFAIMKQLSRRVAQTFSVFFSSMLLALASSCSKAPRRASLRREENVSAISPVEIAKTASASRLNLNTASAGELEKIPGIGPSLAARIVEHRERHGGFRRVEHLLMVRGFSDRRFRQVRPYLFAE